MKFIFHYSAGDTEIILDGEKFTHIFKSRRTNPSKTLWLSSFDSLIHEYQISHIAKKSAHLKLVDSKTHNQVLEPKHLVLAMIDPSILEKTLPFLNQFGVTKLTLFYAQRSQRFALNTQRAERILINSNEQCGRFSLMEFEILENLESIVTKYPESILIDFSGDTLTLSRPFARSFIIGPEGGFSEDELELAHKNLKVIRIETPLILRSESAAIYATLL